MKIQLCSDLHLEYAVNRKWLAQHPLQVLGEILLIAGDTSYLNEDARNLEFLKWCSHHFKETYLIPGNHEYYGGYDFSNASRSFKKSIFSNVHYVNNQVIRLGEIRILCSTLWSQIKEKATVINMGMADFHKIRYGGRKLSIEAYNNAFKLSLDFITSSLDDQGNTIVLTHHLPSIHCNDVEFKNSPLTEAFCVDLTELIKGSKIDYWIYGHSHRNVGDIDLCGTKLISNQLGYVTLNEHTSFDRSRIIEL
jgi:predicted phosphohydrolase